MKKLLSSTLTKYLSKQRYQYLWEIKLLSMINTEQAKEFRGFCMKFIELPKGAICLPQHPFKKSNKEITDFIKEIQQNDMQVCIVVAHVHYNPLDLQAIYLLDCEEGKEEECFQSILKRWKECSELYFFKMDVYNVIKSIIKLQPKPNKWKLINRVAHVLTRHDEELIFLSNIYGEMIMSSGGKRSLWQCPSCGGTIMKNELYENN